jgi:hypothetical protein
MPLTANPTFNLVDKPPFTQTFKPGPLPLSSGAYIYKKSKEDRTDILSALPQHLTLYEVSNETDFTFDVVHNNGSKTSIDLTDNESVLSFAEQFNEAIYIDITGIPTHVWAPLIKAAIEKEKKIKAIYTEPLAYSTIKPNVPSTYYSDSQAIRPLPGLIVLSNPTSLDICFIPLIGFEKSRFDLMMNSVDPKPGNTFPVIGLPGFKLEYPFESYFINRSRLGSSNLWDNIRFATAWCPFALYYQLQKLVFANRNRVFKIGLTGTKPHSLGAILFHLLAGNATEIIYDYPQKKINNSTGIARTHVHHIDLFIKFLNAANGTV